MTACRYYQIAEITLRLESDIPIKDTTFDKAVSLFETRNPGSETIYIRHSFTLPQIESENLGVELYRTPPWAIYKKKDSWIYMGITSSEKDAKPYQISLFSKDYKYGRIFNASAEYFMSGGHNSLFLYPSDQPIIARILTDRKGFYLHSAGVVLDGYGLLFVGHSGSGKSTIVKMLQEKAEILCDDRIILRKKNGIWKIYGTWSHGEIATVSPGSAPLKAVFFLEKSADNRIIIEHDKNNSFADLLACVIRPYADADWWTKILILLQDVSLNTPCFRLRFDKSGKIIEAIESLISSHIT